MKKIGLITTAVMFSAIVFAQTPEKKEHGTTVSMMAKSETQIGTNKGEVVSSSASVNSHSSKKSLNTHTDKADEGRELKEAAATKKAELNSSATSRKEEAKENLKEQKQMLKERKAEAKERISASVDETTDAATRTKGHVGNAKAVRAEGAVKSVTKAQARRSGVKGNVGAVTRLHL